MNRRDSELTKRAQIVALHDLGLSSRVIATRLTVSRTTVLKWIRRHEETGILTDLDRRPRPKLTTPQEDENIRRAVQDDPFTNVVAIRESLHLNVTPQTIRNRLHGAGIHLRQGHESYVFASKRKCPQR
ncbi:hypothetical protein Pcinc_001330 [Petrolisthes cinctipes]|uniref:Transposase n=1 Tax=Petrolisthes cinctipes TaxID=88211 RepID=A0AAE1GN36_PETCI|nr:hypothetical protein Pcinc_001330 [Petrolisthes cinctipes]